LQQINGALLEAASEFDLQQSIGIKSRAVHSTLHQKKIDFLNSELKWPSCWYLKLRNQRITEARYRSVFMVHDVLDTQLANTLKKDMSGKGIQVFNFNFMSRCNMTAGAWRYYGISHPLLQ
jgi:hypothetical protein